jgi:hypothetical protein
VTERQEKSHIELDAAERRSSGATSGRAEELSKPRRSSRIGLPAILSPIVHQVPPQAVTGYFEPVAELSRRARAALDEVGVVFSEETQFDEPRPYE